jgi:hypothetical protein
MFEQRVSELGLQLPPEPLLPKGVRILFEWVRVVFGERCVLSGHGALGPDGAPAGPFGRVPSEVFGEHGRHARTAIGVVGLPQNLPVIISAEVIVTP